VKDVSATLSIAALAVGVSIVSLQCAAQVAKVSPDEVMDSALDMKRAAEQADRLAPLGEKYCGWTVASTDASDVSTAISRFLLSHASNVPEKIAAAKMWRVSFVVGDMIHQLAIRNNECVTNIRYSDNARSVYASASAILNKMRLARSKFDLLAGEQTLWEEKKISPQATNTDESVGNERPDELYSGHSPDVTKAEPREILSAAREMKDAAENAARVTTEAINTKECSQTDPATRPSLTYLSKLVDDMEHTPRLPSYILAGDMWTVHNEGLGAQLGILMTMEECSLYAGEKKKALNVASEALQAYYRLTKAVAAFDVLALQQTEWEEQSAP
jgi:hypothetical protein